VSPTTSSKWPQTALNSSSHFSPISRYATLPLLLPPPTLPQQHFVRVGGLLRTERSKTLRQADVGWPPPQWIINC
jgi:hypothetical protein